jgi:hypothetical protein
VGQDVPAAAMLFEEATAWLQKPYDEFEFWVERDLVWTIQTRLRPVIRQGSLPFRVLNDCPLLPGARRARSADLVIRDADQMVLVAAEFKYHYVGWLLDRIDRTDRLSWVALACRLDRIGYLPWRTRAEVAASPNQASMGFPGRRHRCAATAADDPVAHKGAARRERLKAAPLRPPRRSWTTRRSGFLF